MIEPKSTHAVFDRKLRLMRLQRAQGKRSDASFLTDRVLTDFEERLATIKRDFDVAVALSIEHQALARFSQIKEKTRSVTSTGVQRPTQSDAPRIDLIADEEFIPFKAQSLDLCFCDTNLHYTNDLPGTLVQIRQSLKPDGLFLGAIYGPDTLSELRNAFSQAEIEMEGGMSPRVAPFIDVRDAGALLQRAGFALPVVDADLVNVTYSDVAGLFRDLRNMGETNFLLQRKKSPLRRSTLYRCMEIYHELYSNDDGRIRATFELIYLTGWAPDPKQQQPLRPGSAQTRLAKALGTDEKTLKSDE